MTSHLRSDERAAQAEIERARNRDKNLKSAVKTGANIALTVGGAGLATKLAPKILPLLNSYIPTELALKGINKISPKLGEFLKVGMEKGLDLREGLDFIKEKIDPYDELIKQTEELQNQVNKMGGEKAAPENLNILQKYSDNLHSYISDLIQQGTPPIKAASLAKTALPKKFQDIISKIEKDYKTDFASIVESIFGKGDMAQNQQQSQQMQPLQQSQSQGIDPGVAQILQQGKALLQKYGR